MLQNPFLVPSLCKLNHISCCFIQISTKSPAKLLFPFRESTCFFWIHPGVLGRSVNFSIIKISIKMARVSRLSVSCDYDYNQICKWLYVNTLKNLISVFIVPTVTSLNPSPFTYKWHTISILWKNCPCLFSMNLLGRL